MGFERTGGPVNLAGKRKVLTDHCSTLGLRPRKDRAREGRVGHPQIYSMGR